MTEYDILQALRHVDDPDLKKDIVSLGMVRDLSIEGDNVRFTIYLTTPACPMKDVFVQGCTNAIHKLVNPRASVQISFAADAHKTEQKALSRIKHIIAIYSAKGGVGKSAIAANLAVTLAKKGSAVGLLDADIYGPSIPSIFGMQDESPQSTQTEGKHKMVPLEKYGVSLISLGMLIPKEQAIVWRGPMASTAIKQLVFDTLWPPLDYLIIDMPPGTGDIHLTLMQSLDISGAIVVTTPQSVAVNDTRRAIGMLMLEAINVPIIGLVENMSYLNDDSEKKSYLFGKEGGKKLAEEFGLILLGEIPIEQKLGDAQDAGKPFMAEEHSGAAQQAFSDFADKVVRISAMRSAQIKPEEIIARLQP